MIVALFRADEHARICNRSGTELFVTPDISTTKRGPNSSIIDLNDAVDVCEPFALISVPVAPSLDELRDQKCPSLRTARCRVAPALEPDPLSLLAYFVERHGLHFGMRTGRRRPTPSAMKPWGGVRWLANGERAIAILEQLLHRNQEYSL